MKFIDSPSKVSEFDVAQREFLNAEREFENAKKKLASCADRLAKARYAAGRSKIKPAGNGD